ncbi:MAG TPA: SIS domain-containing protein [Bryobacteraceae bacterium]|nr:SIS domain-containing protein [Bryobacteraceae bacterium]
MSRMLDEIRQQPDALARTLRGALGDIQKLRRRFDQNRPKLVVLAARGTSDNAAQFGRYLIEITTGIPVSLAAPSVWTLYHSTLDLRDAVSVAISQSGESTDINVVLEDAKKAGSFTIGITNEESSALAKLADTTFLVRAGREKSVAATKTYTGQLLMFYLLAWALGARIREEDVRRIPEHAAAALRMEKAIAARAERYRFMERAVVVGRGLNYANAFEFALKLMETSYVVAERFSAADLLHGPIAMVERSFPVFLFAPPGVTWPGMREMHEKMQQLHAETLLFTDRSNSEAAKARDAIVLPLKLGRAGHRPEELYTAIPYVIPAQLFAACLAEEKGLDPDQPRTISKITRTL